MSEHSSSSPSDNAPTETLTSFDDKMKSTTPTSEVIDDGGNTPTVVAEDICPPSNNNNSTVNNGDSKKKKQSTTIDEDDHNISEMQGSDEAAASCSNNNNNEEGTATDMAGIQPEEEKKKFPEEMQKDQDQNQENIRRPKQIGQFNKELIDVLGCEKPTKEKDQDVNRDNGRGPCKQPVKQLTKVDDIKTWPDSYKDQIPTDEGDKKYTNGYEANDIINRKICTWKGDITTLEIDAIVNAANPTLLGGGGVDGAIHKAAGPKLKKECREYGRCEPGDAVKTKGYNLPSKYVIHTVGPLGEDAEKLRSCYKKSLTILSASKLRTIAFPCISTGIYGYPNRTAARVALCAVRDWLEKNHDKVDRIIFCLFLEKDIDIYADELHYYFPLALNETRETPMSH